MDGLPKLPGLSFDNKIKLHHHLSHSFGFRNGHRIKNTPPCGIGREPLPETSMGSIETEGAILYDPVLTYGRVQPVPAEPFRPHYVLFDKMTLKFNAFFKQSVTESPTEHYRIRYVNILYFLEDNSITVLEPKVINCGLLQGRLVRRGKIPKNLSGEVYSWKDFNLGIDIELNGIIFHITDCDLYTKDFLTSQGIDLNPAESTPIDPRTRNEECKKYQGILKSKPGADCQRNDDKLRRFLEFNRKILRFDCILDETERPAGEAITYQMLYCLEDDTVVIKELEENSQGRDHFPLFLRRTKIPMNWKRRPPTYPSCYMEMSEREVDEYYQPKHFKVGETIFVFGRRFLLLDCDQFTRKYFADVIKSPQAPKLAIKFPERTTPQRPLPDYLGLGSPEDSLASCFGLRPKPPKKNVIKYLLNTNKALRYVAVLDSAHPEDSIRRFLILFSLADDSIIVNETKIKNSGILGGKFFKANRVKIPGCDPKMPIYYGPQDFYIGATLIISDHRFRIIGCDMFVYKYMKQYPELFAKEAFDGVKKYLLLEGNLNDEIRAAILQDTNVSDNTIKAPTEENIPKEIGGVDACLQKIAEDNYLKEQPPINMVNFERTVELDHENPDECAYKIKPLSTQVIEKGL